MMDKELFKKCLKRNTAAWDMFISEYRKIVLKSIKYELKYLNMYLPSTEIEDILQDIFLMIWENNKLSQLEGPECLQAWLAITSIHFTCNYCKKHHFKRSKNIFSLDTLPPSENADISIIDTLSSNIPQTIAEIDQKENIKKIEKEISKLPRKQQLAIRLNIFDGLSQTEIARLMKIPKGTASSLLKRSKDFLKKKLGASFILILKGL